MGNNADAVRSIYDAFGTGDVPTVLGAMDPKIDWQEPVSLPYENQIGPEAIAQNTFGRILADFENFAVTAREVIDAGDVVFSTGVYTGKSVNTGKDLEAEFVHVWRFGADGKATGFRTYTDTHLWREALGVN